MMGLTRRQADCLAAIKSHIAERGSSPSYSKIAAALGVRSLSTVNRLLRALKQRGHIDFIPRAARSIALRAAGEKQSTAALPAALQARLDALCAETGDVPASVIADAVDLFLDQYEAVSREELEICDAAFDGGAP